MLFSSDNYVSSSYSQILADATTTSTSYVGIMSQSVSVSTNEIINLFFSTAFDTVNSSQLVSFQVFIDTVAQAGSSASSLCRGSGLFASCAFIGQYNLSAGNHTVEIRWKTNVATARILPVTNPTANHANLLLIKTKI